MFYRRTPKSKYSVDLSFLNNEEASAVLEVLERDKEVRRINDERLKEVKKTNQDKLWLKGVTGQWFEEIRKAKFKDQADITKILKVPRTWSLRKKCRTALSDLKLTQSKSCPHSKTGISHIKSSDNSRGDDSQDPVSRPAASSESENQNTESLSEQNQRSNYNSLQLESPDMFQQLRVQLKAAAVPRVERKIFVYHDISKQLLSKEHPKVLGQDLEAKTICLPVDEHEKFLGTEDLSNSGLQNKITDEEGVKNYNHHGLARINRNDNKMKTLLNTSELSEDTGLQSLPVGCNIENVRHTPLSSNVHAIEQQGNCTCVETGQNKTDNAILSNPTSGLQSSIIEPKNMFQSYLINCADDILMRTHTDGYLSNSKRETARTSSLDLLTESQSLPIVADSNKNRQQSYSSNNICVPSQRDEGCSQSNGESSSFSSMTGPRSVNVGNKNGLRRHLSDSLLNNSQESGSAVFLEGSKSKATPTVSSPVPVHAPHSPLHSIYTNTRWKIKSQNCDNVASQRGSIRDSFQIRQLKPNCSLSSPDPACKPRAASYITINSKNKQQYSVSDNTNIATQGKCNDDHLQNCRDGRERTISFTDSEEETSSVVTITLSKTRMETATSGDADALLPKSENNNWKQNCEDERRNTSLLPTHLIGSQLPTCASNRTGTALQSGDDGYLQKVQHETGHELSADPKTAPQCLTNIIYYNSTMQSNPPKVDAVTLESVNNDSLQNDESETSSTIRMTITQSPNFAYKPLASQSPSSNSNGLNLDRNSIQNYKQASVITLSTDQVLSYKFPIPYSYKYQLLGHSAKSTGITADRTDNEYKSDPNRVLPLSDSTEAIPSETKNGIKSTLQNWPSHTINSTLPEIPSVDNIQNYKSEMTSTPSAGVVMQNWSTDYIHTNKGKSSKNCPNSGNNNNAQKIKSETLPETVNDQLSSITITHVNQDTSLTYSSLSGGNEYLPKDKSETNYKLSAQDSLTGQASLTNFIDSSQEKSLTNFPLSDNITMGPGTIKNAEIYQSEKNALISSQDTLTGQHSPTNTHSKRDKLLIHSPVKSCVIKNLENDQSENYRVLSLPGTAIGSKTPSDILHGIKSTFQNWEQNTVTQDYKQPDKSTIDTALSVLDPVSNQLSLTDNTYCNEHTPLSHSPNSADITGNRKSLGYLQNRKSETNIAIVSNKVTHQLSPMNTMYSRDKQLNYLPNSADIKREVKDLTQQDKSETTYTSSPLDPVTNQLSPINITHSNRYESLSYSLNNSAFMVETGFNKQLPKDNPEISSVGPSTDSLNSAADTVEYLQNDKSGFSGIDPSLDPMVVQQSPTAITDIKKSTLQHYSRSVTDICCDEGPCDQFKSECWGKTNSASSSPPEMTSQWLTSNIIHNNQNKPLIHPLLNKDSYLNREGNAYLKKNKSETHGVDPSPEIFTGLQSTTTITDTKKGTLQNGSSKVTEIADGKKSCDMFTFKILHETNPLSPPSATSQWFPTIVAHNNKDDSQPHSPLSGDDMMNRGCNKYLQKDNSELSTPDSSTDQQSPTNITDNNRNKSLTHSPFIDDISVIPGGFKNLENYQSENHGAISPSTVTGQTNITPGRKNTLQNLPPNNGDITLDRRISKGNVQQDKSETTYISSALDPVIAQQFPTNIPHRSKYESLNYSPNSPAITVDRGGNEYLQKDNTGPTQPDSLTNQQSPTNIIHNEVKPLTHFPFSDDSTLGPGGIQNVENYQSEKSSPVSLQDALTGQQSLTNTHSNIAKSLTHSLKSGDIEVNENLQKYKPTISSIIPPVYPSTCHHSAASVTDMKQNTSQHYTTKVTDIYHRKRPCDRFKLNVLHKTKSAPSSSPVVTSEWLPETISHSDQDKSKTLSLIRDDINLLVGSTNVEKYQSEKNSTVSSTDKLNGQRTRTNTTQGRKNTLQKCPPNIDGITVDRGVNNICDVQDKCETKCMPAPLNPVSSQLSPLGIAHSNEHKPLSHFLNSADITVHRESPDYLERYEHETKSALLSGDKVTQQKSPIGTTHSKNKPLSHSLVSTDVITSKSINKDYNQDKFKTGHVLPALDPVTSQQPSINITHSSKSETLNYSFNSATVTADTGVNGYLQKGTPETNKIPTVDSLTGIQSTTTITDTKKGTLQNDSSKVIEIADDKSCDIFNFKILHETNPLSPPSATSQWFPTIVAHNNKDDSQLHSPLSGDDMMNRGCNVYLQKDNSELSTPDSSTDQQSPTNITDNNRNKSLTHSPFIDDISVVPGGVTNLENYQSENHSAISPGTVTGQTNITPGRQNTLQNLPPNNGDITLDRRFIKDNVQQDKSETTYISSALDPVIAQQFPTNIPHRSKYESLNYSPNSPAITVDRGGNEYLQKDNTGPTRPDSLTNQQSPTNIIHNKVKPLTHFPFSDDSTLGPGGIQNVENYQSEKSSPVSLQDALTGQQSLTNTHSNIAKSLTHSLKSGDIEVNENLQRYKPTISSIIPPVYPSTRHHSAASVTDMKQNTSQHYTTKVTDIYHRKRPCDRFKLNVLHKTKSAPSSSPAVTSEWLPETISHSNQDKSKTLSLIKDDINLLVGSTNVEKYQSEKNSTVSSTDKLNGQRTHTNTTQGRKNTLQKCPPNIDGITVDRGVNNICDVQDKCETKCMPAPLNPVSSQLSPLGIAHSNEHKPLSHFLNSADITVHRESPDYLEKYEHETKSALLSGDKVTQQKSPIDTTYKEKPLSHSSVSTDVITSKRINKGYNQDKFKTSHIPPTLDPVTSQQPSINITHSSKSETLNYSFNSATVTADTGVNEHLQKDTPETNKIPTIDSLTNIQSITDIKKNTEQNYIAQLTEIYRDKIPYERLNFKVLRETNSAPSSPPKATTQWLTTNITRSNQDKSPTHSILSGEIIMNRRNNRIQKNKSETNNEFSLSASLAGQRSPANIIKSKQTKSLADSPKRDIFVMDTADIKNVENGMSENNRGISFQTPIGPWSSTDITCGKNTKFQNWSPNSDMSLNRRTSVNMKEYKSETDITLSLPDLLIDQVTSIDVTCSKSKYLRESTKSGDVSLDRGYNDSCEQIDKRLINSISSSPDSASALLSPTNIQNNRNVFWDHSSNSVDIPPQDYDNAKEGDKIFRRRRKSFCGEMFQNRILRTWMENTDDSNSLQQSSPEENQTDSDITEINNFRNRLNAYSDFSRYRGSSSSIDEDSNSPVNNYQAGTARFSKNYSRFTSSLMHGPQNTQRRHGSIYKAKSLKDIHSDCNQSSLQDHENVFSTNILHNSELAVRNRQVNPSHQFSNRMKSSRLCRSYSDLLFSNGNEFDYNNWTSYHGSKFSLDNHELVIENEDRRNVSKEEEEKKETHLENMKRVLIVDRLWKPGYLHEEASSPRSEDVFNPLASGVNQDPGVNDDNVQNDEYFPVDIKIFWPKENPTDIIRLLSSSSTGSKISEDSLSPQQHRTPAVIDKQDFSRYSDTNSDTTTDDEYFLDGNDTVKESAL